jgi:hypothetical protein
MRKGDTCIFCKSIFCYDKADLKERNYEICMLCNRNYCPQCQDKYDLFHYLNGSICILCYCKTI